jgi:hypothetical protein
MYLKSIYLYAFRNYREQLVKFDQQKTIVIGNNAQGKSNLLESVELLATLKSHRVSRDRDLVLMGADTGQILAIVERNYSQSELGLVFRTSGGRSVTLNRENLRRHLDFLGTIKLVIRTLLARKGRSFLTILGIVIGVAGVIIIIALGAGAQSLILGQITKLGSDLLSIQPGKSNEKGPPAQVFGIVITTLSDGDADDIRDGNEVPHAKATNAMVRGTVTVTWQNKTIDTNFIIT